MSEAQQNKRNKLRIARLEIVAELLKRGYSYRRIRAEVIGRLDLPAYSLCTVKTDVDTLMAEWREARLTNVDDLVQLELERIDDAIVELREQWELSKGDRKTAGDDCENGGKRSVDPRSLGNVAYWAEIRAQLVERRKLLGLYSPDRAVIKTEVGISRAEIEAELSRLQNLQKD